MLNTIHSLSPTSCLSGGLFPLVEVEDGSYVGMGLEASPQVVCNEDPNFMGMDLHSYKRKYQEDGREGVITNSGKKAKGVHEIKEFDKVLADSFKSVVATSQRRRDK